jgi:hypothetical protein
MQYKTLRQSRLLNNLPPKGLDMGYIYGGVIVEGNEVSGYDHFINMSGQHRYIKLTDVQPLTVEPPPVEPETFAAPAEIMARWKLADGTYTEYFLYRLA